MIWIPRSGCYLLIQELAWTRMVTGSRGSHNMLRMDGMGLAQQLKLTTERL